MSKKQIKLSEGEKVYFHGELQPYTVKACDNRFAICTKPYNPKRTVLYTIVDLKEGIRGTNNLVFNCYDYKKQKEILECLKDLQSGETEITRRNRVPLQIMLIEPAKRVFIHSDKLGQVCELLLDSKVAKKYITTGTRYRLLHAIQDTVKEYKQIKK